MVSVIYDLMTSITFSGLANEKIIPKLYVYCMIRTLKFEDDTRFFIRTNYIRT